MCQGRCVVFLKNIRNVILGKKDFLTGRQFWNLVRLVELIILLYLILQAAIFVIHRLAYKTPVTKAKLWSRRLYGIGLLLMNLTRVFMIHEALKSTEQPMKMQKYLKYYYRLFWMQCIYAFAIGIYAYYYEYFFKNHWTFQTYFSAFVLILLLIVLCAALWHAQSQIRRIDSPMMQKLREYVEVMKCTQNLALSKEPQSRKISVDVEIEKNPDEYHEIEVSFDTLESRIISSLDIIMNDMEPIGEGMFGIVHKGVLLRDGIRTDVVLKGSKHPGMSDTFQMLLQEIKTIIHAGDHPNIIKFFGVTSQTTLNCACGIVNEYCINGNLNEFLLNPAHFSRLKTSSLPSDPTPDSKFQEELFLQSNLLIQFSQQICVGMEHLASKKVVHGDLATRNVLVTDTLKMKITDFGLSHRLYNYQVYSKIHNQETLLPWRWLSIEALEDLRFSEKSDVWAYGITLWEIFSFGESPYPGLTWNSDFTERLRSGFRLQRPYFENLEIYSIMKNCWLINIDDRPTFAQIKDMFAENFNKNSSKL